MPARANIRPTTMFFTRRGSRFGFAIALSVVHVRASLYRFMLHPGGGKGPDPEPDPLPIPRPRVQPARRGGDAEWQPLDEEGAERRGSARSAARARYPGVR